VQFLPSRAAIFYQFVNFSGNPSRNQLALSNIESAPRCGEVGGFRAEYAFGAVETPVGSRNVGRHKNNRDYRTMLVQISGRSHLTFVYRLVAAATFIFKAVIIIKRGQCACVVHACLRKVGLRFKYDERTRLTHSIETAAALRQSLWSKSRINRETVNKTESSLLYIVMSSLDLNSSPIAKT
jgi:hypothetical protein